MRTQESSTRYYQRVDAHHLEVDPTRTSLSGFSADFSLSKIGGGHWRWSITGHMRSPGFETNDMGYLMFTEWMNHNIRVSYKEYKPGKVFRDYDISFHLKNSYDWAGTNNNFSDAFFLGG